MVVEDKTKFKAKCLKQGETHGNYERFIRVWRTFWSPNTPLEPKDEKIYLWREKRYLYYRSTKDYPLLPLHLQHRS